MLLVAVTVGCIGCGGGGSGASSASTIATKASAPGPKPEHQGHRAEEVLAVPAEPHPPSYCPGGTRPPGVTRRLVGLRRAAAVQVAGDHGCSVRVVRKDGNPLTITLDYLKARIDVWTRNGRVVKVAY